MTIAIEALKINWHCSSTWKRASYNTSWCLLGCAIGDMGTILYFQVNGIDWPVVWIMSLAIVNGLLTSIILETIISEHHLILQFAKTLLDSMQMKKLKLFVTM